MPNPGKLEIIIWSVLLFFLILFLCYSIQNQDIDYFKHDITACYQQGCLFWFIIDHILVYFGL